ncbi:MAG: 4-alpha-glucanotransferase [Chitinophagaceae bacterium]|nr:4-alpha-glucanotransferase [Chitinophagaceae bacterium]
MKIHFNIRFGTRFGQSLLLSGNIPQLGSGEAGVPVAMNYLNEFFWSYDLELDNTAPDIPDVIQYNYLLKDKSGEVNAEWDDAKMIDLGKITTGEIFVTDTWNFAGQAENALYTAPFRNVLLPVQKSPVKPQPYKGNTHVFKVKAPLLAKNEVVCLLGSVPQLGKWNIDQPLWMSREGHWWTVKGNLSKVSFPVAYKYAVYNSKTKAFVRYEEGDNRLLQGSNTKKALTILHDGFMHFTNDRWRGAGVAIPVFSLRSANGLGVGEFTDLRLLADWAKKTGIKLIQLLPVNDTIATYSWRDSYPYNAISAFALHPLYLNIEIVAGKEDAAVLRALNKKRKELNQLAEVDYEAVLNYKWKLVRELYKAQKESFFANEDFLAFFGENKKWLTPYVVYSYLRDKHKTADFNQWKQLSVYDAKAVEKLAAPGVKTPDGIGIYYFVQYHLHVQLKDAVEYAHKKGVVLKGDIAIGVSPHSCDAWMEPALFHLDMQAGAPPDAFAVRGQNWGFPTYNWKQMELDGFEWWHRRFRQMSYYFDAFRIDHILGFFRIWSIPVHAVEGVMGHFVPAVPVHINEFAQRGISFDYSRFCTPYISDDVLNELPGEKKILLKNYLEENGDGTYALKEAFATQRQVEAYFAVFENTEEHGIVRDALYELISNILLFEVEGSQGQQFHFRIDMEKTSNFRFLGAHEQYHFMQLYIDYFYRRQDALWARQAMHILPALKKATHMLVCGEDLGMVPDCVPEIMRQLGLLSLEIQRMPKQPGVEFFKPEQAPYLSVITPSTHDMSTIRGWWEEDRGKTQRFFNHEMQHPGLAPFYCESWIDKAVIIQHLYSPAMWSIFQLQDLMGIDNKIRRENPVDERINVPAIPRHYWRYRMHITLEQLLKEKDFNNELTSYIHSSGRA